jgi:hypothetical protein
MSEMLAYDVTVRVWVSFFVPESDMTVRVWVDPDDPDPDLEVLAWREVKRKVGTSCEVRLLSAKPA